MEIVANVTAAREVQEVGGIVEPIDRGYLARVTLGNRVLEREVLELFAGQLPVYVAQLRAADSEKDWKFARSYNQGFGVGGWGEQAREPGAHGGTSRFGRRARGSGAHAPAGD